MTPLAPPPTPLIPGDEPLTVKTLKVDSFMRLEAAELRLEPSGLIPVRGRNDQGKSSLLTSLATVLG